MGTWTNAQRTIQQLIEIMDEKRLIPFDNVEASPATSAKVTCIYVTLQPLKGFVKAIKCLPDLLAMISNQLGLDRKLIYHLVVDDHTVFSIHPCDWKKDEGKLFNTPSTNFAFEQAVIAHQIIDIFNEMCISRYPQLGDKAACEVFIGMATGSYHWTDLMRGSLPSLSNWTEVHKKAFTISQNIIPGYSNTRSNVHDNGIFMNIETYSGLDNNNQQNCNMIDWSKDSAHTNISFQIYDDFKQVFFEYGSVDVDAVAAFEKKHNRSMGSPWTRTQLETMYGDSN